MADKTPVRVVFDSSNVATGLAEFQTGETLALSHGGTGSALSIGLSGQVLRVNAARDALEFVDPGDIDIIASSDSTGVQVQDDLNVSGTLSVNVIDVNEISSVDSTAITIKDDLMLAGTLRAEDSGTISIDGAVESSGAVTSGGIVTATGFTIGSAVINEAELETIDGITAGTVTASKAIVVDSNKDIGTLRNITSDGTIQFGSLSDGTITVTAFVDEDDMSSNSATLIPTQQSVKAYVDANAGGGTLNVLGDDSTDMEITLGTDRLFFQGGTNVSTSTDSGAQITISIADAPSFSGAVTAAGFTIGSAAINESELETIDGVTAGTVAASKAVVVDSSKDIGDFRNVTATGSFIIGSADMNETDLEKLDGITNGTVAANKAVVVDGNKDAGSFRNITATGTITTATLDVNSIKSTDSTNIRIDEGLDVVGGLFISEINAIDSSAIEVNEATNFNANVVVKADVEATGSFIIGSASMNETDLEKLDGITNGTAAANKAVVLDGSKDIGTLGAVTATSFVIGSADINETDLEKIDGITNGTVAASKAVVVDSNKDAGSFRNITATGTVTTATLDVNSIKSTDSSNIRIDEGLDVVGGLFVSEINAIDSSAIEVNEVTNFNANVVVKADVTATGSFIIGSASMNETDLEKLDGITNGTVAANKAVVVDGNKDAGSFRNITATGATTSGTFVIGSADINEADLEQIDGLTAGTVTASKAVVVDSNKDIGTFRNLTASGNGEFGGNLQVGGNLTVSGTQTSVNTTNLEIQDALLELNKNNSGGADVDAGIFVQRGSAGNNAVLYWNEGDDTFKAVLSNSAATATSVTDSSFAGLEVGSLTINGGMSFTHDGGDVTIANATSNKDLLFTVNDGGSATEVFRLDGDVSALLVASGKELQFADSGEKISGDGTDLTIASGAKINLNATSDIHIPNDVGIVFGGASEKIEGDGTDLVISANNLTIDAAADIVLDAAGNDFNFKANGTEILRITNSSSDVIIRPVVDAKDIIFQQRDGTEVARVEDNGTFNVVTSKLAINGTAITSTAAELNALAGITAVVGELNALDIGSTAVGTAVASKAVILDSDKDYTGIRNLTVTGSFIIGSADMNETDLEKLDGITNGTAAANKAVVVDGNKDIGTLRNITSNGTIQFGSLSDGTITATAFVDEDDMSSNSATLIPTQQSVKAYVDSEVGGVSGGSSTINIVGDDSTDMELTLGTDRLFIAGGTNVSTSTGSSSQITISVADAPTFSGAVTAAGFTIGSAAINESELETIDGVTAGTVAASKAVVVDSNKDAGSFRNITATGATTSGTFVIGSADINEADLEQIDGLTAGTVTASKAVVVDSNKDIASFRNITLTGELDAGSLDVSGNADIDGTLEADAITVNGTSLAETIQDTVGAMVSSNTESGITVAYQDSDGTLDFTVGTLNQDTTGSAATLTTARNIGGVSFDGSGNIDLPGVNSAGNQNTSGTAAIATTVTVSDNESTNENNVILFAAGAAGSGNLGVEADGNMTYNPSTGKITATGFIGALTGDVTGDVTGNADTATALATARNIAGQSFDGTGNISIAPTDLTSVTAVAGEINALDLGSTAVGNAIANKAVILDSNKDYTGLRNVTLSGELDAGSLDVSGNADIDGTLEADAITVNGTSLADVIAGTTVNVATLATTVTITDNESTNENNALIFTAGGDTDGGNLGLESDGTCTYNPSTGKITATGFVGNLTGTASAAQYSDLAERYHADAVMEKGDVIEIGGENEITKSTQAISPDVFGVISHEDQAAFKMNDGLPDDTHPLVALTGRADVKVIGPIDKGDRLVTSSTPGVARKALMSECTAFTVIGRALQDKTTEDVGLVLCYVTAKS